MDDLITMYETEHGTEEGKTTKPFEGKSYTFETRRYKAVDLPCVINERNVAIPVDEELANSIVNSVSTTVSFYNALQSLDDDVKETLRKELPGVKDGVVPSDYVTLDNLEATRKVLAKLNKIYKQSEDTRKSGKSIINKPYDYMNSIYKEKTYLIVSAIEALKSQVAIFDKTDEEVKMKAIREDILKRAKDYNKDLPELLDKYPALYDKVFKKEFLNKTMSDTKMQESIMSSLASISAILKTLDGEKDSADLKAVYFETGDLSTALQKRQSMDEARAMIARMSGEEAPKAQEPTPTAKTDEMEGGFIYKTFTVWHKDKSAFVGLVQYLKNNGFHAEILKNKGDRHNG